jgi:hypothetical protein
VGRHDRSRERAPGQTATVSRRARRRYVDDELVEAVGSQVIGLSEYPYANQGPRLHEAYVTGILDTLEVLAAAGALGDALSFSQPE